VVVPVKMVVLLVVLLVVLALVVPSIIEVDVVMLLTSVELAVVSGLLLGDGQVVTVKVSRDCDTDTVEVTVMVAVAVDSGGHVSAVCSLDVVEVEKLETDVFELLSVDAVTLLLLLLLLLVCPG
jgi:hypothetical protein